MKQWQIHVVLYEVELDDQGDPIESAEVLEEEELAGYRDNFTTEESAREVFRAFSGVKEA